MTNLGLQCRRLALYSGIVLSANACAAKQAGIHDFIGAKYTGRAPEGLARHNGPSERWVKISNRDFIMTSGQYKGSRVVWVSTPNQERAESRTITGITVLPVFALENQKKDALSFNCVRKGSDGRGWDGFFAIIRWDSTGSPPNSKWTPKHLPIKQIHLWRIESDGTIAKAPLTEAKCSHAPDPDAGFLPN